MSGSGLITGTPTDNSDSPYTVEVTVTDGQGASATLPLTLTVDDALAITPSTLPSAAVGTPYSQQLTGSGGSGSGYTYSATGLPTGLTISLGRPDQRRPDDRHRLAVQRRGDDHRRRREFRGDPLQPDGASRGPAPRAWPSSANPAIVGQSFTLTATVSAFQAGSVLPDGGTVSFFDGATLLGTAPVVNGTAQFPVSSLGAGPHSLTATFSGNADFQASASQSLALTSLYPVGLDVPRDRHGIERQPADHVHAGGGRAGGPDRDRPGRVLRRRHADRLRAARLGRGGDVHHRRDRGGLAHVHRDLRRRRPVRGLDDDPDRSRSARPSPRPATSPPRRPRSSTASR